MNVRVFSGHRETGVTSVCSASTSDNEKFVSDFSSCDEKGFVATWDLRSPKKMSNVSLPFLMTLMNNKKNINNKNNSNNDDDDVIEISEIINNGEYFTTALSEEYIAMIDWRKPRTPAWTYSLPQQDQKSSASPFASLLSTHDHQQNNNNSNELFLFHEEGQVTVLNQSNGEFIRNAPSSLSERTEMQLPCGVSKFSSNTRFAVVASTFGHVSLLDLQTWNILGSVALGGMKDEQAQQPEDDEEKSSLEKMTNPPLLASLNCIGSPFVIGGSKNDEDEDEVAKSSSNTKCSFSSTALVSRADGVIAFAHVQPNTHPAVTRFADITTTDLSHSLCSANWIRHCANTLSSSSAVVSCVGMNGLVTLWQVPATGFKIDDDEEEGEDEVNQEEEEADLLQLDQVNLMNVNYAANEAQKTSVSVGDVEMNCSCIVRNNRTGLVVGDTAGRILWVDME